MMVIDLALAIIGGTLFLFAEHQINRMTRQTKKCIRLCFTLMAVGGLGIATIPLFSSPLLTLLSFGCAMSGAAILIVRNRRTGSIFGCRGNDRFWLDDNLEG